jgi:hypothetical protein
MTTPKPKPTSDSKRLADQARELAKVEHARRAGILTDDQAARMRQTILTSAG